MRKDNDIEALKRQSSSEFDYQHFSTGKKNSGNKHRWKLLEGVANWSPGGRKTQVRSSVELSTSGASSTADIPRHTPQVSAVKQATTLPVSHVNGERRESREYRSEERSRSAPASASERGVLAAKPATQISPSDKTSTREPEPFGNLFKGYTENSQEAEDSPKTSLKALLRQIDS